MSNDITAGLNYTVWVKSVVRSVRTAAQLNGSWSAVPGKAVSCGRGLRVPLFSVHVIQLSTNLPTYRFVV